VAGGEPPVGFVISTCKKAQEFRIAQNVVEVEPTDVGMKITERPSGMEVFEEQSLFFVVQWNKMSDLRLLAK
jgi:hypothetical protein